MERLGTDFGATGSVMSRVQLEELRKKRGECTLCGQKCFQKKLFKMIPITDHGRVLNGRCLSCHPLDPSDADAIPAVSRPATREDMQRFIRSQSQLSVGARPLAAGSSHNPTPPSTSSPASSQPNSARTLRSASVSVTSGASLTGGRGHASASSISDLRTSLPPPAHSIQLSSRSLQTVGGSGISSATSTGSARSADNPSRRLAASEMVVSTSHSGSYEELASPHQEREHPPVPRQRSSGSGAGVSRNRSSGGSPPNMLSPAVERQRPSARRQGSNSSFYSRESMESGVSHNSEDYHGQQQQQHRHDQHAGSQLSMSSHEPYQTRTQYQRHSQEFSHSFEEECEDLAEVGIQPSRSSRLSGDESDVTGINLAGSKGSEDQRRVHDDDEALAAALAHSQQQDTPSSPDRGGLPPNHPTAVALHDYYRRSFRNDSYQPGQAQRSWRSHASDNDQGSQGDPNHHNMHPPLHGRLDRGGAVSFVRMRAQAQPNRQESGRPVSQSGSSYGGRESSRSLESMSSFCAEDAGHGGGAVYSNGGIDHRRQSVPVTPEEFVNIQMEAQQMAEVDGYSQRNMESQHSASERASSAHRLNQQREMNDRGGVMRSHSGKLFPASTTRMFDRQESFQAPKAAAPSEDAAFERLRMAGSNYEEILSVMRDFPDSPTVQSDGMQELSNLDLTAEDSETLGHIGAIYVIIAAMQAYPAEKELQLYGCRAMWNASGTEGNQVGFVEAGALDVILADMDQFLDDAELQELAMATLANLGAMEVNLEQLIEKNTIGRIVEAMNKHSQSVQVQLKGCGAITNMASHTSPLKKIMMENGAGGAVVISMVMHPDDPLLQEKALRALRNLSANCDENKIQLAHIGGVDAVISAMQVHRDAAGVQEAGAWTLSNLAGNPDNKPIIGETGGIDVIIRAMWVHSDTVSVQEWCCRALFTLSLDNKNCAMMLEVGGISAIVNAMQAHVDSAAVQEMGCAVLCNLAYDESCKMRIVDEEALDAIVLAMVLHTDNAKVQERACQVLLQLAIVENFKSMQASNIGELARIACQKFPNNCREPSQRLLHVLEGYVSDYS